MFNTLAQGMASGIFGEGALNNAVLESFTLHARALLDFLYTEKPQADDEIAEDYFDDPLQWPNARPEETESLKMIHKRVGKEVAHLTYARLDITPEAKQWPFVQIAYEINIAFSEFLKRVPTDRLSEDWIPLIEQSKAKS